MKVVITGGSGFLGKRLTNVLLKRGALRAADGRDHAIDRLTLVDVEPPASSDPRVVAIVGDITDRTLLDRALADTETVFHLAAVVSGKAEEDFDLGMHVNLDGTRQLLEVCRARRNRPRLVFASSLAVYGGDLPELVLDSTAIRPLSSYGTQKAVAELLIADYTRRAFVDGRIIRLPTIAVRPGPPNAAASSFVSAIVREPLDGKTAVCPVDPETRIWLASPWTAVHSLIAAHDVPAKELGANRTVTVPGISITARDMVAALERVAGPEVAGRVRWDRDPRIEQIVATWPGAIETKRARALGFPYDEGFEAIIRRYIDEEMGASSTL
jgi:nucleoside-diphosphate-sugar epimerase